jgi:N-acetyl sugar amidotransferase
MSSKNCLENTNVHCNMTQTIKNHYQQCKRCLMDTSAIDIIFDNQGFCNYCTDFINKKNNVKKNSFTTKKLQELISKVKFSGKGKPYDCIVGISGGLDSSWTLVEAKRLGLRPLAVHMDNGWNSELAQNNIANLVRGLDVDLYTYVIDWEEYRELMQSFFNADVIDIELLYDNAMLAVNFQQANKYQLKYILTGANFATEGMAIPKGWNWLKYDKKNITALALRSGIKKIRSFPAIGTIQLIYYYFIKNIRLIPFPDYISYNKFLALDNLEKNYGYKRYLFKHYESVFTRFYQAYILPKKFNVDKRRLHLSSLIISEQISREEALKELSGIAYKSEKEMENDINYFLKKMKWTESQLNDYINRPSIPHSAYPNEKSLWDFCRNTLKYLEKNKSL